MSADQIQKRRAERFLVLRTLYDLTNGNSNAFINFTDLVEATGLDEQTVDQAVDYLHNEHLAGWAATGTVEISHDGVKEIEEAFDAPEKPTEHFPPIVVAQNYVKIEGSVSGQVQVGTTGSTQTMGMSADDLRALLAEVRGALDGLTLDADEEAEIESDLRTVEAQLESPRPKHGIVRAALSSARSVLENVAAKEAAAGNRRRRPKSDHASDQRGAHAPQT